MLVTHCYILNLHQCFNWHETKFCNTRLHKILITSCTVYIYCMCVPYSPLSKHFVWRYLADSQLPSYTNTFGPWGVCDFKLRYYHANWLCWRAFSVQTRTHPGWKTTQSQQKAQRTPSTSTLTTTSGAHNKMFHSLCLWFLNTPEMIEKALLKCKYFWFIPVEVTDVMFQRDTGCKSLQYVLVYHFI